MATIGTVIEGKYEILREIGKGGMSVVYLAMDTHLNKQWAVKEIRKKGDSKNDEIVINSLLAEANLMKRLDHSALPRIVDIIDDKSTIFVVMDYIEGKSLDKILDDSGPQPEELVVGWAKQLCDVLSYLHTQQPPIIYRDMKPANIMLKPEGNVKLIDLGIAGEENGQIIDLGITKVDKKQKLLNQKGLGTKGYAPQEQSKGQTDARSDIFALGMTMHHLLTGIDPRKGEKYVPVRMWNPELSRSIELIIHKCVEPDPENRYQNCKELILDLEDPDGGVIGGRRRKLGRKLNIFAASAALSLLCLASGVICGLISSNISRHNYDVLVDTSTASSLEDKKRNYKEAIAIYPERVDAYLKLIEAYEDEGKFGKKENDEFLALYNANKSGFDRTGTDVAELNYKIGMMYFNYYTEEDGSYSFSTRVQKAYSFFKENDESVEQGLIDTFENNELSDCYYQICSFYKQYILNDVTVEEASRENYEELFAIIESALQHVESASAYDQLSLYNGTFMLLYDQRGSMMQVNVEQNRILSMLEQVYNKASSLMVQKEQSKNLQQEVVENYDGYKEAVMRTYANAGERKQI